jgi:hypothetical protein
MLLWILLPPVFVACLSLALAAPFIVQRKRDRETGREVFLPDREAVAVDKSS